ncbi:hypothetical protein Tco_0592760, partial [Tanacetum coccineum]
VVRAICNGDITLVHILSLKSNIWNLFRRIDYLNPPTTPGILFNGALHWFWFEDANYYEMDKASIVSFDLAKEEFRVFGIMITHWGFSKAIAKGNLAGYASKERDRGRRERGVVKKTYKNGKKGDCLDPSGRRWGGWNRNTSMTLVTVASNLSSSASSSAGTFRMIMKFRTWSNSQDKKIMPK